MRFPVVVHRTRSAAAARVGPRPRSTQMQQVEVEPQVECESQLLEPEEAPVSGSATASWTSLMSRTSRSAKSSPSNEMVLEMWWFKMTSFRSCGRGAQERSCPPATTTPKGVRSVLPCTVRKSLWLRCEPIPQVLASVVVSPHAHRRSVNVVTDGHDKCPVLS